MLAKVWSIITKSKKFVDADSFLKMYLLNEILLKNIDGNNLLYENSVIKKLTELFIKAETPVIKDTTNYTIENLLLPKLSKNFVINKIAQNKGQEFIAFLNSLTVDQRKEYLNKLYKSYINHMANGIKSLDYIEKIKSYEISSDLIFKSYHYTQNELKNIMEKMGFNHHEAFKLNVYNTSWINSANDLVYHWNYLEYYYGNVSIKLPTIKHDPSTNLILQYCDYLDRFNLLLANPHSHDIRNSNIWYEDLHVNTVLNSRINEFNATHGQQQVRQVHAIALYDTEVANESSISSIVNGLQNLNDAFNRVVIPINLNHNHCITAIVTLEEGRYNITFTDSLNSITDEIYEKLENLFREAFVDVGIEDITNLDFQMYTNSRQQEDYSSCGAYAIENTMSFLGGEVAETDIRNFHYQLYERDLPERYPPKLFERIWKKSSNKQAKKQIDIDNFKYNKVSENEILLEIKGEPKTQIVKENNSDEVIDLSEFFGTFEDCSYI